MTEKEKPYSKLLRHIPKGKENGVSRKQLAETLHISVRDVSALVLLARQDDIIIASGNRGYYFPANLAEAYEYYNVSHKRAITILQSLKSCRNQLKGAGMIKGKQ